MARKRVTIAESDFEGGVKASVIGYTDDEAREGDPFVPEPTGGEPIQVAGLGGNPLIKELFKKGVKELDVSRKAIKEPLYKSKKELTEETIGEPVLRAERETEANRILDADLGDFNQLDDHQINFDAIDTTDDVKAVIGHVAEDNKGAINEARRGKITHDQLRQLADDLGTDEEVIEKVMKRQAGEAFGPEVILAARQVLGASAKRIQSLAEKVRQGNASQREMLQFRRQMDFHREYLKQLMGARAEAGRALNAFGIPAGDSPREVDRIGEMVANIGGEKQLRAIADRLEHIDTMEGLGKEINMPLGKRIEGMVFENFVNSILSGMKTHIINASGNALFQGMDIAETAVAAQIGRFKTSEERVFIGEATAKMYGLIHGQKAALKLAWKALKSGEPDDAVMRYEGPMNKAISGENLGMSGPLGRMVDWFGVLLRVPTERVMLPVDEYFKGVARHADLAAQGFREANRVTMLSGDPKDGAKVIQEFFRNPPKQALDQAQAAALYKTFQNPLGPTGQKWQAAINDTPYLRMISPFIKTPVNIFKAGLIERSPVGIFSARMRKELRDPGPVGDMAKARMAMGTLTSVGIATMVLNGQITGGGPSNPRARAALKATGWQPYSRVWTDSKGVTHYTSYRRAEPLAYIIGATADIVEIQQYGEDALATDDERINHMATAVIAGIAENTTNKTFLQGLADFNQAIDDPQRYAGSWGKNFLKAQIPYSAFRRDISRLKDPYVKEAWTIGEKIRAEAGIPGYDPDIPNKVDIIGRYIEHPGGSWLGVLSPFPESTKTKDKVLLEIESVMNESRTVPITKAPKRIEGVPLTAKQYHDLEIIMRREVKVNNENFYGRLKWVMDQGAYKDATPDRKATLLRDVQELYLNKARDLMKKRDKDLAYKIDLRKSKKRMLTYGFENLRPEEQELIRSEE